MKLKLMFSAALIAGVISAQAATSSSTSAIAGGTNSAASTNSGSVDAMTTLFGDPVIAKGTGFQIKRSDLDSVTTRARASMASSGQQVPQDFDAGILYRLIQIQMLLQQATDADKANGQAEADKQYSNIVAHASSPEALERQLRLAGITADQFRAKAAQEATANAALKRALNISVTEAQIENCYSNHESNFEVPERVHVAHILLMTIDPATGTPLSTNTIASKHKQAEDVLKRAKAGEDFGALARQYSEDPGSKANNGEIPPFARDGRMVAEFEVAAFSLSPGQISDIVTSKYGFHIIKLLDKMPAKKYGVHDEIPDAQMTPGEICKDSLESDQIQKLAPAYIEKLRKEQNVQITDPTLKEQSDELMEIITNSAAQQAMPQN